MAVRLCVLALAAILFSTTSFSAIEDWEIDRSPWIEEEQRIALLAVSAVPADLLVVPMQGPENRFDAIERSLVSAIIAAAARQSLTLRIPSTNQVRFALGKQHYQYAEADLLSLAQAVGAADVLEISAQHDREGSFELRLRLIGVADGATRRAKTWTNLEYGDTRLPSQSVITLLPDILTFIADGPVAKQQSRPSSLGDDFQFPESAQDLVSVASKSPLHTAAFLQLLGCLHPDGAFNEARDDLFVRSLVALQDVTPGSDERKYFEARAYAYLDRRPAALAALGEPGNHYEQALLDALNGNLPSLRAAAMRPGTSPMDLFVQRDLVKIEAQYRGDFSPEMYEKLLSDHPRWADLIERALMDPRVFNNASADTTMHALSALLPETSSILDEIENFILSRYGRLTETDVTDTIFDRIRQFEEESAARIAKTAGSPDAVTALDLTGLAREILVANHIDKLDDDLNRRALPQAALDRSEGIYHLYAGHPEVELYRASALRQIYDDAGPGEKPEIARRAHRSFRNGLMWTGRSTYQSIMAGNAINLYFPDPDDNRQRRWAFSGYKPTEYPYRYYEWPAGQDWFRIVGQWQIDHGVLEKCLDYTWTAFGCLKLFVELQAKDAENPRLVIESLLGEYEHRFVGHPLRSELYTEMARAYGAGSEELDYLEGLVKAGSTDWSVYYSLGRIHKRQGRYREAQRTVLQYPGFKNVNRSNAVAISDYANTGGSWFFWTGQYELSVPLFQIANSTRTGSAANYMAAARLALIAGNLEEAEQYTLGRAQRYQSAYALRDLMQFLHLRGESEAAWAIFDQFQPVNPAPQIWSGALVGHKKAAATTDDVVAWIKASPQDRLRAVYREDSPYKIVNLAPRYLLLHGLMDRLPTTELAEAIAAVRIKPQPMYYEDRHVSFNQMTYRHDELISTPPRAQTAKQFDKLPTPFEWYAMAMVPFLRGDFDEAFDTFNEIGYYYYLREYLPYYAFSAARTGNSEHIWGALNAREPALEEVRRSEPASSSIVGHRFNEDLTYAVLHAFSGDHAAAMRFFRAALNDRPFTSDRTIFTYYQVVDLAIRLYESTGHDEYRDFAFDLARRHTVIQPMHAWAYFVVAQYSSDADEKQRALQEGLDLDPLSYRGELLTGKVNPN